MKIVILTLNIGQTYREFIGIIGVLEYQEQVFGPFVSKRIRILKRIVNIGVAVIEKLCVHIVVKSAGLWRICTRLPIKMATARVLGIVIGKRGEVCIGKVTGGRFGWVLCVRRIAVNMWWNRRWSWWRWRRWISGWRMMMLRG
ncbi:hypothetical protein BpHYR1_022226, partial [Brachionus plicatilis]